MKCLLSLCIFFHLFILSSQAQYINNQFNGPQANSSFWISDAARVGQDYTSTKGGIGLRAGDIVNAGYLEFFRPGGVRKGYIGYGNDNTIYYYAEDWTNHIFMGGNVAIGTTTPVCKFEVSTTSSGEQSSLGIHQTNTSGNPINQATSQLIYSWYGQTKASINFHRGSAAVDGFMSFSTADNNIATERMRIDAQGNVSIGAISAYGYKLAVAGNMIAEKIRVKLQTNWPDYVFHESHSLPSIKELETFIKTNKHLPGVPTAKETKENGIDLGQNQAILLEKIEELTLYLIEQNKKIEAQQKRLEEQDKRLKELEAK